MPYNGSGVFSVVYNFVQDAANGIKILASRQDTQWADIATNGLTNCVTKDGQSTTTVVIPFAQGASFGGNSSFDSAGILTLGNGSGVNNFSLKCGTGSAANRAKFASNDAFAINVINGSYSTTLGALLGLSNDGAYFTFNTAAGSLLARINMATGAYTAISDTIQKTKRTNQTDYMPGIRAVWLGDYDWTETGAHGFGPMAQQAYEVLGDLGATPGADGMPWTVNPATYGYLALWGVQKLAAENDSLRARLTVLEAAIEALESK